MKDRFLVCVALLAMSATACSGGAATPPVSVPAANNAAAVTHQGGGMPKKQAGGYEMQVNAINPVTKNCPGAKYAFCVLVSASTPGPYFEWSSCSGSNCPQMYEMSANNGFYKKSGTEISYHKISWYQSPGPGNPDYVYIYEGDHPFPPSDGRVRIIGKTSACYYYYPSDCSATVTYGIMFD